MKWYQQSAALLLAGVMGTGCLTGCGGGSGKKTSYTEEELPYGSTMRSNKTSYAVPITYDRRFLDEAQVEAVAGYLGAIQNNDAELFASYSIDLYTDYQINEVYNGDYSTLEELVGALHLVIASQTAEDFKFTMVTISDYTTERNVSGMSNLLDLLDSISEDGRFSFSATVEDAWTLELEWSLTYNDGGSYGSAEQQKLYLLLVDGAYYCAM